MEGHSQILITIDFIIFDNILDTLRYLKLNLPLSTSNLCPRGAVKVQISFYNVALHIRTI